MTVRKMKLNFDIENTWRYKEIHLFPSLSIVLDNSLHVSWYAIQGSFLIWRFELSYC
jgi:hypothetical protein